MLQVTEASLTGRPAAASSKLEALRVLHLGKFYPPHPGGMETHLQALCGELQRSIKVSVVVAGDERKTRAEVIDGVQVTRAGTMLKLGATPVCPETVRLIRETKPDIVHLHHPNPAAIVAYLASGHRGPSVFTYHSDIIRQRMLRKVFWPLLRRALSRAAAIIVTSPNYLDTSPVLQRFRKRCHVIPFGIPLAPFDGTDTGAVAALRARYGPRIVLGVGRLVYYKGFAYLIRAMKDVAGHLLIVGKGPLRAALEREARACGVSERVSILTDVADVRPYYHAADVFALASVARSEAFGIVQLEAMACGKPVVNTWLDSGVPFVSPDRETGLTVPPADATALSTAFNTLLDDPALSAKYGRAGRRRVEQEFNVEVMAQRTLRLYEAVMNGQARESE